MNFLTHALRLPKTNFVNGFFRACFTSRSTEILSEIVNKKRILTLNRPEKLNTLNLSMITQLTQILKSIDTEKSADLVILRGNGRAFCAGGDVVAVVDSFKAGTSVCSDFFIEEYKANFLLRTFKVPFIALINGITMGGGCGVSINGRFQVATEQTMLSMPETALGLFPDVGGTFFLSRLKKDLGMFLALTGHRLRSADVFHAGLATHFVSSESLPKLTETLVNLPANQCTFDNVDLVLKEFAPSKIPLFFLQPHLEEIAYCFSADNLEGVFNRLQSSGSDFAKKQLEVLHKMSPTSLKVTFRQIRIGKSLKYEDVIPIEFRLTQRFLAEHDFHEGCRAILIDKDRNPKWNPDTIQNVSDEKVDWYFSP